MTPATSHQPPVTVGDVTERDLIARIRQRLPPAPAWVLVGIGDDAAVIEPERNRVDVLTVDAAIEGVHFDRACVPPDAIGHRALAVNLSDLAAMGAAPRVALLSMALPSTLPLADFDAMIDGVAALAARHRVHVVGGNLTRSPGPLMIDVTLIGTVKRRQALTRGGARPGDFLYVSGTIGAAAAGLQMLKTVDCRSPAADSTIQRYLRPEPRVRLGLLLGRNRAAAACMDLSDGLAEAAHGIADASDVGMILNEDALPIDAGARAWYGAQGVDVTAGALTGGDDYELLVAVRPRTRRRATAVAGRSGTPMTCIGTCTEGRAVLVRRTADGRSLDVALPREGFAHFR